VTPPALVLRYESVFEAVAAGAKRADLWGHATDAVVRRVGTKLAAGPPVGASPR